ncbi:MAG: hypothetical protein KAT34_01665 [Candidatus Aminicenantes bacterium]|nr:hypothetical protein [Candidatus Aminicenantes bacterium]
MSRLTKLFYLTVALFVLFYFTAGKKFFTSTPENKKDYQYLALFSEIVSRTKIEYFEAIKPGEKFPGAYTAVLGHLDKVSAYLDARQTQVYDCYRKGNSYHPGIYGAKLANYFYISGVVKDSPAGKAGLKPGDIIKSIREQSLYNLPFYQMYFSLLSDKPENIDISVYKKRSKNIEKISLHTRLFESKTRIREMGNNILVVEIPKIDEESAAYLLKNLKDKENLKLIIDLRHYTGGNFQSLLEIASIFFKDSPGFTIRLKKKKEEGKFPVGSDTALGYRAVIIINKSTIMYGELLAALFKLNQQDNNHPTTIIGRKTPGFISQVKQIGMKDGSSILLSEGFFLIKDEKTLESGIKPDIELKLEEFDHLFERGTAILNEG